MSQPKSRVLFFIGALVITVLACTQSASSDGPTPTTDPTKQALQATAVAEFAATQTAEVAPPATSTPTPRPTARPTQRPTSTEEPAVEPTATLVSYGDIENSEDQAIAREVVVDEGLAVDCTTEDSVTPIFCPNDPTLRRDQVFAAVTFIGAEEEVQNLEPEGFIKGWWQDLDPDDPEERLYAASLEYLIDFGFDPLEVSPGGTTFARPEYRVTEFQSSRFLDRLLMLSGANASAMFDGQVILIGIQQPNYGSPTLFNYMNQDIVGGKPYTGQTATIPITPQWPYAEKYCGIAVQALATALGKEQLSDKDLLYFETELLLQQEWYCGTNDSECPKYGYCGGDGYCKCNNFGNGSFCGKCKYGEDSAENGPAEICDTYGDCWSENRPQCDSAPSPPPPPPGPPPPPPGPPPPPPGPGPGGGGSSNNEPKPTAAPITICQPGQAGFCYLTRMQWARMLKEHLIDGVEAVSTESS